MLGYIKVTVDPVAGTATAQVIRVADVSPDLKNLTTIYPPGTVFETVVMNRAGQWQTGPVLTIPSTSLPAGASKIVPVMVKNITHATGIGFNLSYDRNVIHITDIRLNSSVDGSSLYARIDNSTGTARIAFTNTSGITYAGTQGIFDVYIHATGSTGNTAVLAAGDAEWTDDGNQTKDLPAVNGTVQIEGLKGDFNNNARVDIGDVTRVAYMAVDLIQKDLGADFNGNNDVDAGDAAKIAWYYVGKFPQL
jgi:hypothetical protein